MSQDETFIQNILDHPEDPGLRLIYADWLDEQNDPRGSYLRLEAEIAALPETDKRRKGLSDKLRNLTQKVPPNWLVRIDRTPIENCISLRWEFECPKRWEELQDTKEGGVRFCDSCQKNVFHCATVWDAYTHARKGHCVAIDSRNHRSRGDFPPRMMMAGQPSPPLPGDPVAIVGGQYKGYSGRFDDLDETQERATVHIMIDNRSVLVLVDRGDLEFR